MRYGLGGGLTLTLLAVLGGVLLPVRAEAQDFQVLHNFGAPGDGIAPAGALVIDAADNLYGATGGGPGEYGFGTIFELSEQEGGNWQESLLYTFPGPSAFPHGPPTLDSAGNLYGTFLNSIGGGGGVYELRPSSGAWNFTVLSDQAAGPGVAMSQAGYLYGEIGPGDYFGIGAIGMLMPGLNGWTYTELANFDPSVGYDPPAPPIPDGRGGLIGVTNHGGITQQPTCPQSFGCGVIFDMTPDAASTPWDYRVLHKFASFPDDGEFPSGGLVRGPSGAIYGITAGGGADGDGTIFELTRTVTAQNSDPWAMKVIYDFPNCNIGCGPGGTLAVDQEGNLYGAAGGGIVACGGDIYSCGVVFRLSPHSDGTWSYTMLHAFTFTDGAFPIGVTLDGKGNLFGVTGSGGTYDAGVAFEITP